MDKKKNHIITTIVFAIAIVLCIAIAVIAKPKQLGENASRECQEVNVQIRNVETKQTSFIRFNKHTRYYVTIEYDGQEYELGPLSSTPYRSGTTAVMYLSNGRFYQSEKDAEKSASVANASIPFKISVFGVFISIIAFAASLGSCIKDKKHGL